MSNGQLWERELVGEMSKRDVILKGRYGVESNRSTPHYPGSTNRTEATNMYPTYLVPQS